MCAIAGMSANASETGDIYGSAKPYAVPTTECEIPDSLEVVMVNHVGRHGARYPSGPSHTATIRKYLSGRCLTLTGRQLINIADSIDRVTEGRWGALDSIGEAEQAGIAHRMVKRYGAIFADSGVRVKAESSYVTRCVASMYAFLHEVSKIYKDANMTAESGPQFSPLLRFFSINNIYKHWADSIDTDGILLSMPEFTVAERSVDRLLAGGDKGSERERLKFLMAEYSTLAIQSASGGDGDIWRRFLTAEEMKALWALNDVRQHLLHSASEESIIPSLISRPLLRDILNEFEAYLADTAATPRVALRFGHAETLMPLLALMDVPGCRYTGPSKEVPAHWLNYEIVPMAANVQMVMLRSKSGRYYVATLLNERPVVLPGLGLYAPWRKFREYLEKKI